MFTFFVMWQPIAPVVVITVAQKEVRRSSVKRENSALVGGWMGELKLLFVRW